MASRLQVAFASSLASSILRGAAYNTTGVTVKLHRHSAKRRKHGSFIYELYESRRFGSGINDAIGSCNLIDVRRDHCRWPNEFIDCESRFFRPGRKDVADIEHSQAGVIETSHDGIVKSAVWTSLENPLY
jgi:hypothetical protein